jgi:hypothetical protein
MRKSSPHAKFYDSDKKQFQKAFTADKDWFRQWGDVYEPRSGDLLIHQDNGKKILIVAHTDFVVPTIPSDDKDGAWVERYGCHQPLPTVSNFGPYKFKNTGYWFPEDNEPVAPTTIPKEELEELSEEWVAEKAAKLGGPVVDDRLGCALALGCTSWADILFTDCEEDGESTAAYFQAPRAYNWIIGFDRRGTDVVTYDYKDKDWLSALESQFTIGHGSFSDIGYLEKLGTACVNMGIGYYNEHTTNAFWKPKETEEQLNRLYAFWSKHSETQFNHIPPKTTSAVSQGLARHQGKDQYSLHGREWLLEVTSEPTPLSIVPVERPWVGNYLSSRGLGTSKSFRSTPIAPERYIQTTIDGTVWDDYAGDYRSLADIDWDSPEVKDFIAFHYPNLVPELVAWQDSLQRDMPIDPLLREYGYSSW